MPDRTSSQRDLPGCRTTAIAFDFDRKEESEIDIDSITDAFSSSRYVWIDVEVIDPIRAAQSLVELKLFSDDDVVKKAVTGESSTIHARYADGLHLSMTGARLEDRKFSIEPLDVIIGQNFILTIRRRQVLFLERMRNEYRSDFLEHAKTPSFLIYELWDHLIDNFVFVHQRFEERVAELQRALTNHMNEEVFEDVSNLGSDLLNLRKAMLPARDALLELSSRKSRFISEATQPYLANMVGTVDHLLQDLIVDRDILSDTLNLRMSVINHRTNEVVKKLTAVSILFLPLMFLCGIWGMNFTVMPELHWKYGYALFWAVTGSIAIALIVALRRRGLL